MKILLIGNDGNMANLVSAEHVLIVDGNISETPSDPFDAIIDFSFDGNVDKVKDLQQFNAPLVFVNSVETTGKFLPSNFVRFNGWKSFVERPVWEAYTSPSVQSQAQLVLKNIGKTPVWTKDDPGFISARVVAMIINEAFLALQEGVSTKEEIDLAMKLGTGYPYGPFEWNEMIGASNIHRVLKSLNLTLLPEFLQKGFFDQ